MLQSTKSRTLPPILPSQHALFVTPDRTAVRTPPGKLPSKTLLSKKEILGGCSPGMIFFLLRLLCLGNLRPVAGAYSDLRRLMSAKKSARLKREHEEDQVDNTLHEPSILPEKITNGDSAGGLEKVHDLEHDPNSHPELIRDGTGEKDGFGMCRHDIVDMESGRPAAHLTALFVMAVYYRTLSPSITGGDSGEVMAAACSWGPAHPPGYPLFVACANLAMWLFASLGENKAYRVNLMCAVMTAIGVYNLHRAARIITGSSAAATVGAAMYGFSPLIWNNALQAEVFSMNNMFVCLITHILVRYLGRNDPSCHREAYLGAFIVGLGLSNQHTLVLYAAIIVPAVFISGWRRLLRPAQFLSCTLLFTLGMTPYSHMWWLEGCPIPWAEQEVLSLLALLVQKYKY
jgi:hypothetical protein